MRRRGNFTRKRRHRTVSWLTTGNQRQTYTLTPGTVERFSVGVADDNDFVENHPRFAKRNDIVPLRRIVGHLRLSMYYSGATDFPMAATDGLIEYGLCIVKGDYDESGVWSPTNQLPDPRNSSDYDDKWLFTNSIVTSFGAAVTTGFSTNGGMIISSGNVIAAGTGGSGYAPFAWQTQNTRPICLSTDQQLPNGSYIDISTRRKLQYGEKLSLITTVTDPRSDPTEVTYYAEVRVKTLIAG